MDKANFMQTIDRLLLTIKPVVGKRHPAGRIFFGWYSSERNSAANPYIGCGWGHCPICMGWQEGTASVLHGRYVWTAK